MKLLEFIKYIDEHMCDPFVDPWSRDPNAPHGYIYVTTNLINGMKYIGQHSSKNFDDNYLGSGKYIRSAIDKYGKENFIVELIA